MKMACLSESSGHKKNRSRRAPETAGKEMRNTLDCKNFIMNILCKTVEEQLGIRLSIDGITGLPYSTVNGRIRLGPTMSKVLATFLDSWVSPFAISEDPEDIRKKRELFLNDFSLFNDVFYPSVFRDFFVSKPRPIDVYEQE